MKIKKNKTILIFISALFLVFIFHFSGLSRPLESLLLNSVKPLTSRFYSLGSNISGSYSSEQDIIRLQEDLAKSRQELAATRISESRCLEIESENEKLRQLLEFKKSSAYHLLAVDIVASEAGSEGSRDLIIDRGERDGVIPVAGVVSQAGAIVGKVIEVKDDYSKICLTTSPGCQLAASVQNREKTQGITDGNLGLTIDMSYIPQLEKINIGDLIVTSGLGGNIPRGLLIGRVSQVNSESNEVWQQATIDPYDDFSDLTIAAVIIP